MTSYACPTDLMSLRSIFFRFASDRVCRIRPLKPPSPYFTSDRVCRIRPLKPPSPYSTIQQPVKKPTGKLSRHFFQNFIPVQISGQKDICQTVYDLFFRFSFFSPFGRGKKGFKSLYCLSACVFDKSKIKGKIKA
jgi:hypothetical protein